MGEDVEITSTLPSLLRSGQQLKTLFGVYQGIPKTYWQAGHIGFGLARSDFLMLVELALFSIEYPFEETLYE